MKQTYKPDKLRIEDALIPALLEELMQSHIEQMPDADPKVYDWAFELLLPDIMNEMNNNKKLFTRLNRTKKKTIDWMASQKWGIPKAYMVVRRVAYELYQNGKVDLGEGTLKVVQDINDQVEEAHVEEKILRQDESAIKQAPKLLKIIQQQGYFI